METIANIQQNFGTVIRALRRERNLSQEELANLSGLHRTYITDIERGTRNVSLKNITRIAAAMNLSLQEMFMLVDQCSRDERNILSDSIAKGSFRDEPIEIVLIEDDQNFVELTLYALNKGNIINHVRVLHDGEEAQRYLFDKRMVENEKKPIPGVILLDLFLPLIDGFQLLENIKNNESTKNIPVVVMTSSVSRADMDRCLALGVEAYLTKPISIENFTDVMRTLGFRSILFDREEVLRE